MKTHRRSRPADTTLHPPATPHRQAQQTVQSAMPSPSAHTGQQHPIGLYLGVWLLLFVLSTLSYLVDYVQLQGLLRWSLIVTLMLTKAGLIVAVFMHLAWERLALIVAVLLPPLALLVLIGLMWAEGLHTYVARGLFFN
jgi:cytochrome c oxidase subunit IV